MTQTGADGYGGCPPLHVEIYKTRIFHWDFELKVRVLRKRRKIGGYERSDAQKSSEKWQKTC